MGDDDFVDVFPLFVGLLVIVRGSRCVRYQLPMVFRKRHEGNGAHQKKRGQHKIRMKPIYYFLVLAPSHARNETKDCATVGVNASQRKWSSIMECTLFVFTQEILRFTTILHDNSHS